MNQNRTLLPSFLTAKVASTAAPVQPAVVAAAPQEPIKLYSADFYKYCGIGGAMSCGLTHFAIVPLDLVKCRLQVNPGVYKGMFDGFRQIVAKEGAAALMSGWAPTLIGYSLQGANKFGFYEFFKKFYADLLGEEAAVQNRTLVYLAGSATAEVIADAFLCPFEAVKVRIQTQPAFGTTLRTVLPRLYAQEGAQGLFKGLVPLWLRQIPYTMVKFACFERTVELIYSLLPKEKHEYGKGAQLSVTFASGYIAGVFCAIVSHPADTVVSKLNQTKTDGGTGAAIAKILSDLGFAKIWTGLGIRVLMIGTLTGLQWFIYDSFKAFVGLPTSGGPQKKPAQK